MSIRQPRLFAYNNRTSEVLVGASVHEATVKKMKDPLFLVENKVPTHLLVELSFLDNNPNLKRLNPVNKGFKYSI